MGRFIGIRHRLGETVEGEQRATQVCAVSESGSSVFELPDEAAQLDWAFGTFVFGFRRVKPDDNLSDFAERHVVWRKLKKGESPDDFPKAHVKRDKGVHFVCSKVPKVYGGLTDGDTIAMVSGGSGSDFAYRLFKEGERRGVRVMFISPARLKETRGAIGSVSKDDDAIVLATLIQERPDLFYPMQPRDLQIMLLRKSVSAWRDAQKDRIACELRLHRRAKRTFMLSNEPQAVRTVEDHFLRLKASDERLRQLVEDEEEHAESIAMIVQMLDVYREIFVPITGCGVMLAARIIAATQDIRRFPTPAKYVAYMGAHVKNGGEWGDLLPPECQFPRREAGEQANWNQIGRQAGYLFAGDQAVKRKRSDWGRKLLWNKEQLRQKYPEPVTRQLRNKKGELRTHKDGSPMTRTFYTPKHIHNAAVWRTMTQFYRYVWQCWNRFEKGMDILPPSLPSADWEPRNS